MRTVCALELTCGLSCRAIWSAQVNAADTQSMVDAAAQSGLFFAAGLWTRFFPATQM